MTSPPRAREARDDALDRLDVGLVDLGLGLPGADHDRAVGQRHPDRFASLGAWGDNSVSSCRSHSRAKGPGTSADAFSMARSLCGEGPRGHGRGTKGSCGTPASNAAPPGRNVTVEHAL